MNKKNKLLNGNDLLTKQIRYAFSSSGNMEMDALVTVLALWHAVKKYFSFVHKRSIHSFNLKDWDRVYRKWQESAHNLKHNNKHFCARKLDFRRFPIFFYISVFLFVF